VDAAGDDEQRADQLMKEAYSRSVRELPRAAGDLQQIIERHRGGEPRRDLGVGMLPPVLDAIDASARRR